MLPPRARCRRWRAPSEPRGFESGEFGGLPRLAHPQGQTSRMASSKNMLQHHSSDSGLPTVEEPSQRSDAAIPNDAPQAGRSDQQSDSVEVGGRLLVCACGRCLERWGVELGGADAGCAALQEAHGVCEQARRSSGDSNPWPSQMDRPGRLFRRPSADLAPSRRILQSCKGSHRLTV